MEGYALLLWLRAGWDHQPDVRRGEFTEAEIKAWKASSRRTRRRAWIAAIRNWLAGEPAIVRRGILGDTSGQF